MGRVDVEHEAILPALPRAAGPEDVDLRELEGAVALPHPVPGLGRLGPQKPARTNRRPREGDALHSPHVTLAGLLAAHLECVEESACCAL